jgi:hypothetical protein
MEEARVDLSFLDRGCHLPTVVSILGLGQIKMWEEVGPGQGRTDFLLLYPFPYLQSFSLS